jgi:flagellar hook-associated protein 1 FlgK
LITDIGNKASAETTLSQSQNDFVQSLNSQQQQVSGVSLDQQAIQLMQYQENYQAAAKVVTAISQLFDVLMKM